MYTRRNKFLNLFFILTQKTQRTQKTNYISQNSKNKPKTEKPKVGYCLIINN